MAPRLTIVVPLKGRQLFALRFFWHANKQRLPYRFLIADGQVTEAGARLFEDGRRMFPTLDIEYIRYPDDIDYSRFFTKMYDAMQRVRTPYVMQAEVDDFVGLDGVERALDFLDANPDYVSARGREVAFSVTPRLGDEDGGVSGKFNRLYLTGRSNGAVAPTAIGRVREGRLFHELYYAIHRAAIPLCIWREIAEINFSDLTLHENFYALRALTLGKVHTNKETITYYSQAGTSTSYEPLADWARHFLCSRFTSDAHAIAERIASSAKLDGLASDDIAEEVRTILECYYRYFLSVNYGLSAQIKRVLRKRMPWLVAFIQNRPGLSVHRERAAILSELKPAGASKRNLKAILGEFAMIEDALSPQAFAEFAGPVMSRTRDERSGIADRKVHTA